MAIARGASGKPWTGSRLLLWCLSAAWTISIVGANDYFNVCPVGFFNFGDSLTDTGSTVDAFPFVRGWENPPYGSTFFKRPAKRSTNGRVVPDFFSNTTMSVQGIDREGVLEVWTSEGAIEVPPLLYQTLLQPYVQAGAFDLRYGVNFAFSGATATNDTLQSPFYLPIQIGQFLRFKKQTASTNVQPKCAVQLFPLWLPQPSIFESALYTLEIGTNDILNAINSGNSSPQIENTVIPAAVLSIVNAIKQLYNNGARRFLVFNAPNAGCSSVEITILAPRGFPLDAMGCITEVNRLARRFNTALAAALGPLRTLTGISIGLFRYYDANQEILVNPSRYGFNPAISKAACCGASGVGTLNFNPAALCGFAGSSVCPNPEEYVYYDGVRFTESFYRQIAKWALNGEFTDYGTNYTDKCYLDFTNFGSDATYDKVFPPIQTCSTTFT